MKSDLNITFPSKSGSSKCPLAHTFPHQHLVYVSPLHHTCTTPLYSHSSGFDHQKNNIERRYKSLSTSHAVFSSPLLPPPYEAQIMSSKPNSQTHSSGFHVGINTVVKMYAASSNSCSSMVDISNTWEVTE